MCEIVILLTLPVVPPPKKSYDKKGDDMIMIANGISEQI